MKASEFDEKFDSGEDIASDLDITKGMGGKLVSSRNPLVGKGRIGNLMKYTGKFVAVVFSKIRAFIEIFRRLGQTWTGPSHILIIIIVAEIIGGCGNNEGIIYPINENDSEEISWNWEYPVPQGFFLKSITFTDDGKGLMVGSRGAVISSNDFGVSWKSENIPIIENFSSAHVMENGVSLIIGPGGAIVRKEGTSSWREVDSGMSQYFTDIESENTATIFVVGSEGCLGISNDAGINWMQLDSGLTQDLNGIAFNGEGGGVIVGDSGAILWTENSGTNWEVKNALGRTNLVAACFSMQEIVVVATDSGELYVSSDSTESWRLVADCHCQLMDVTINRDGKGLAVGHGGVVQRTSNGGNSWVASSRIEADYLFCVEYLEKSKWLLTTNIGIFETNNDGDSWDLRMPVYDDCLRGIDFIDDDELLAVGDAGALIKFDLVEGWRVIEIPETRDFNSVEFSENGFGVAVGESSLVHVTEDGGSTWRNIFMPGDTEWNAVSVHDNGVIYIGGNDGSVKKSQDFGLSWNDCSIDEDGVILEFSFCNSDTGFAVGEFFSGIYVTENGGETWSVLPIFRPIFTYGVHFFNRRVGYVVGGFGLILKTFDGGENWIDQSLVFRQRFNGITCVDNNTVFVYGQDGKVYKSVDGGGSWLDLSIKSYVDVYSGLLYSNSLLVVGYGRSILSFRDE